MDILILTKEARIYNEEKTISLTSGAGEPGEPFVVQNETRTLSNTIHKINSKWIKDLNVRPGTIKLLEENIGKTLTDINHSRILYDPSPRVMDLITLKSICATKETISKVKKQPSDWEKIIANEATDKQLISKIYKQLLQLNSRKKKKNQINGPKN